MEIREILFDAFPSLTESELDECVIRDNPDLLIDNPGIEVSEAIPFYMQWCVEHTSEQSELIFDYTIGIINECGRAKDSSNHLDFKFRCNDKQKQAVVSFLNWCGAELLYDHEPQLSRAKKNWAGS